MKKRRPEAHYDDSNVVKHYPLFQIFFLAISESKDAVEKEGNVGESVPKFSNAMAGVVVFFTPVEVDY